MAHVCLGSVLPLEMFVFKLEVGLVGVRLVWRIVTVWGELRGPLMCRECEIHEICNSMD